MPCIHESFEQMIELIKELGIFIAGFALYLVCLAAFLFVAWAASEIWGGWGFFFCVVAAFFALIWLGGVIDPQPPAPPTKYRGPPGDGSFVMWKSERRPWE